jgi:hypothetical protein
MNPETASMSGSFSAQPAMPVPASSSNDRLWSVFCHLSYFFGLAVLAFVFPTVVYFVMRTDSPYVAHHAREALNFHLSLLLYFICCVPLCFILIGVPLLFAIGLVGLVCSLVAAVKASRGECYRYPVTIHFVG